MLLRLQTRVCALQKHMCSCTHNQNACAHYKNTCAHNKNMYAHYNKPDRATMRPGRVSACIDHVTYMERQMDEHVGWFNLVDHLFQYRISPWPETAERRDFCTCVADIQTDGPTDG